MKKSEFIKQAARGDQIMQLLKSISIRAHQGSGSTNLPANEALMGLFNKLPTWKGGAKGGPGPLNQFYNADDTLRTAEYYARATNNLKDAFKGSRDTIAEGAKAWRSGAAAPGLHGSSPQASESYTKYLPRTPRPDRYSS